MNGYVYVLTNPSMPGLIKIGRTTNLPSQRMAELHSTGVPTPFQLEFCVEVEDCVAAEKAAHRALAEHRIASGREFFRTSVKHAINSVLPVLGKYAIYEVKETHGIERLEEHHRRSRDEQARLAAEERAKAERRREDERTEKMAKVRLVVEALARADGALKVKGRRPPEEEGSGLEILLWFCFFPVPVGWLVWIGTLQVFSAKASEYGFMCIGVLIAGYFAYSSGERRRERNQQMLAPWVDLDKEIFRRTQEIKEMGLTVDQALGLIGATCLTAADSSKQSKPQHTAVHATSPNSKPAFEQRSPWVNIHGKPFNPFAPRDDD